MNRARTPAGAYSNGNRPAVKSDPGAALEPGRRPRPAWKDRPRLAVYRCDPLLFDAAVAWRLNVYAACAYPYEVGGLLRVVRDGSGWWRVVDLYVPPQRATHTTFALDAAAVARWKLELLADGREQRIAEWGRGVWHTHPRMAPFLSPVDHLTLVELADDDFAFSVVCTSQRDPRRITTYAAHFAQGAPLPLVLTDLPIIPRGGRLAGTGSLTAAELRSIARDVDRKLIRELLPPPPRLCARGSRSDRPSTREAGGAPYTDDTR